MDKRVLKQWLKAGYVSQKSWYPSEEGTPQGAIISPTLANMVLDGMAKAIDDAVGVKTRYYHNKSGRHSRRDNNPYRVNFVRYADDWIVTATNKDILQSTIIPTIKNFLTKRGLELSDSKTTITNVYKGFNFLGQHLRKYSNDKLLTKPSKESIKKLLNKIRTTIKKNYTASTVTLINQLNRITQGWAMYHRHGVAKKTFSFVDYHIWNAIWKWCLRRHRNKGKKWIVKRYFTQVKGDKWIFFGKDKDKTYYLQKLSKIKVYRYTKIKASTNPYYKQDEVYLEKHLQTKMVNNWHKKRKLITIFRRQQGKCPMCQESITKSSGWNIHHKIERFKGGKDTLDNLVLLHPTCHHQVHFWNIQFDGDVPIGSI